MFLRRGENKMDKLIIKGGKHLKGTVRISGAKNASLPCMAASILAEGTHTLKNVPHVADIRTMAKLLCHIGIEATEQNGVYTLHHAGKYCSEAPYDIVKTMRASSLVLGPMIARFGHAKVSLPGGCAIGARPLNLHIKALEAMGVEFKLDEGYITGHTKKLRGANIHFDNVTVTGTENIIMAAVLADGTTVIENAAKEPEVPNLADYLVAMGARISGAGSDRIVIEGVKELHSAEHEIIPDRIEAGTFACAAAITRGDVTITNASALHIEALLQKLRETGCEVDEIDSTSFRVKGKGRLKAVDVPTAPYPGFATDLQAQTMACLTTAEGSSVITENIFENRFMHVQELLRLGADIKIEGKAAIIRGVDKLHGAPVMATDLRASASLVLAGLAAEGTTEIQRIYHLDRGYEKIEEKLIGLGADIKRGHD